ncbi:MAG: hypothetical protein JWO56_435 [Acidobacteria bacterium]|nr:hypothetical protein [Acidobacteriota bacterium]
MKTRSRRQERRNAAGSAGRASEPDGRRPSARGAQGHSFADISVYPESAQPVPEPLRAQFERVTRTAVGGVRVHTGPASQRAAEELEARAFTIGREIHFGAGEFQPGTAEGDRLLAHELTHAVQQRNAVPTPQMQLEVPEEGDDVEDEADDVADAVLDDEEEAETPAIVERPAAIAMQGKKTPPKSKRKAKGKGKAAPAKAAPAKAAKPKAITFSLFKNKFTATVDAAGKVTVAAAGKSSGGWTFKAAGANKVTGERTLENAEYVHAAGTRDPLVQRVTISVPAGGPAAVPTIVAEKDSPPTLTVELSSDKGAAKTKSVTFNAVEVKQLDLPSTAIKFTPADGDSIHLGRGGDAWVFTTLKPDKVASGKSPAPITGFFYAGFLTRYVDKGVPTFGIATPGVSDADRIKAMEDLTKAPTAAGRRITTDEAKMFETVSLIESDFAGVQTYDTGILSFGFSQWTVSGSLPRMLLKVDATTFERYLGRYGLAVGPPVRQLESFVRQFAVKSDLTKLGLRNKDEGAIFLNKKELVTTRLRTKATAQSKAMGDFAKRANALKKTVDDAKPDLTSTDKAKKAAATKTTAAAKKDLNTLRAAMAGHSGVKAEKDPSAQAALLAKVATAGEKAAKELLANSESNEAMRSEEWSLRFQMLGKSPGGQDAEIAEARRLYTEVSTKDVDGISLATLLPNLRGRSALLSSYINLPTSAKGVKRAVDQFKTKKQAEAKAAAAAAAKTGKPVPAGTGTEADWKAFPWASGDGRWKTLWTSAAIDELEQLAIAEVTKHTTDPAKRKKVLASQFP